VSPRSALSRASDRCRRTAAARRQAETFLERPVFGIKRPFSNTWGIRGPRGRHISIERRRRDAEAVRDLSHADVGIGEHRLGGLDVLLSNAAIIATPANITPYNSTIESTGAFDCLMTGAAARIGAAICAAAFGGGSLSANDPGQARPLRSPVKSTSFSRDPTYPKPPDA